MTEFCRNALGFLMGAVLAIGLGEFDTANAEELKVGVATIDITPPLGYRMAGYYSERKNTGTKDPLQAKALVVRQGNRAAALVFCDLVGVPRSITQPVREAAARATGIPWENIAVGATHSHTGPLFSGVLRKHFDHASTTAPTDAPTDAYLTHLKDALVSVISKADAQARPARLSAGFAEEPRLSFNRRFHMKNGEVRFNPGPFNPDIVKVAGPIDPDVGMIAIRPPGEDRLSAVLTVFAMHLDTVGGTEYSADYPFYLERELRSAFNPDLISLFGAGTCGDINHVDVTTKTRRTTAELGTVLGRTAAARLPGLETVATPSLAAKRAVLSLPLQSFPPDRIATARVALKDVGTSKLSFLEQVEAVKIVDLADNYPQDKIDQEVQVFRLGPELAVVALPGEVFVEHGLAIKKASPFATTLIVELMNDNPAYIPTLKGFSEGSYEIINSRLAPGSGEKLVEAAVGLLKELDAEVKKQAPGIEAAAMLMDILKGSQLGPTDGWFSIAAAQTRHDWTATLKRLDRNHDDRIDRGEFPGTNDDYAALDRDHDGELALPDFDFSAHALTPSPGMMLFYRADRDGNGKLTTEEWQTLFQSLDRDRGGFLALADLQNAFQPRPPRPSKDASDAPEGPSRWTLIRGLARQEIGALLPGPSVGESAPDFTLKTVKGDRSYTLSKLIGPKPVVLIFGNFTCGPFRAQAGNVEKLYRRYKDRATFLMIYVREAHPTDGWSMESNQRVGVALAQPRTFAERVNVAQTCQATLGFDMPFLIDTMDDSVGGTYSGMPSRLYLIDRAGKLVAKSGRGPFGFKPAELEHSLILELSREAKSP